MSRKTFRGTGMSKKTYRRMSRETFKRTSRKMHPRMSRERFRGPGKCPK